MTIGKSWKPTPKPPVDKELENLKKVGIEDPEEIKECKDIFLELREALGKSNGSSATEESKAAGEDEKASGPLNLEMFMKVGQLKVCRVEDKDALKDCLNPNLVDREVK